MNKGRERIKEREFRKQRIENITLTKKNIIGD